MNFTQLRAFHAVAISGTFSGAAQSLGVSQPAITQHIKSLEETLGARLFNRTGAMVELTADAQDLLPKIREVMLTLDDIGTRMGNGRTLRSGHLSLGVCSPCIVMPILERFSTCFPGVSVTLRLENSSRLLQLVAHHRVDLALVTLNSPHPDFLCEHLVDQEVQIIVGKAHPWWDRESLSVHELANQPFILREEGSMTRQIFERGLAQASINVTPRLMLASREAVKEAVAAGLGAGIVLSQELGFDPRLKGIPILDANLSAGEYIVCLPEMGEIGAVREFVKVARD